MADLPGTIPANSLVTLSFECAHWNVMRIELSAVRSDCCQAKMRLQGVAFVIQSKQTAFLKDEEDLVSEQRQLALMIGGITLKLSAAPDWNHSCTKSAIAYGTYVFYQRIVLPSYTQMSRFFLVPSNRQQSGSTPQLLLDWPSGAPIA